jgi:hypothetical protein
MSVGAVDERATLRRATLRLVSAADDARSWIERNLHDAAQPQFVAAATRLCPARQSAAVVLRLRVDHGGLCFEVSDTGIGFDVDHAAHGAGLPNIHDPSGALGERFGVLSRPGGETTVRGTNP